MIQSILDYPAATVACFDPTKGELPRRILDHERNVAFLERLAGAGVPAVLIAASTGHGHLRTVKELQAWLASAAAADLQTTAKMALLRPEDGFSANEALCDAIKEHQFEVVFVRPGTDLSPHAADMEVAENMRPLLVAAAARQIPVGLYSIPDVSGLPLTAGAAELLVNGEGGDQVVAVKVTEADYEQSTLRFLQHPGLKHLKIVQGWDPHLARALRDGPEYDEGGRQRCGVTSGPMSLAVHQYLHILEAARNKDWQEVELAQQAVTALFVSMQDDPRKFADLQGAKYIMGLGHPLTGEIGQAQVDRVLDALRDLPRVDDRCRLAKSLDIMGDGPYHELLCELQSN